MNPGQKADAIDMLKKLDGVAPYDRGNPCRGDGIYAQSIRDKFGMSIDALGKASGYDTVKARWEALRSDFR